MMNIERRIMKTNKKTGLGILDAFILVVIFGGVILLAVKFGLARGLEDQQRKTAVELVTNKMLSNDAGSENPICLGGNWYYLTEKAIAYGGRSKVPSNGMTNVISWIAIPANRIHSGDIVGQYNENVISLASIKSGVTNGEFIHVEYAK
ncbi:MAG: hypothetical protein WCG07_01590 [Candidatus Taylorbacteria bacterium]